MKKTKSDKPINEEIIEHYSYDESQHLKDGFGQLELERTKELIRW